jgi:uncharacterized tellurite resistance protein B-like protein
MNANDEAGKDILCLCLASVSMADGDLDASEIAMMIVTLEQATGCIFSADELVGAAMDVGEDPEAFREDLQGEVRSMEAGFKTLILKTCIQVGRSDSVMIDVEKRQIFEVGRILGFSDQDIEAQFQEIH